MSDLQCGHFLIRPAMSSSTTTLLPHRGHWKINMTEHRDQFPAAPSAIIQPEQKTRTAARARFFFFSATATTEIYTLSLHDALPISGAISGRGRPLPAGRWSLWRRDASGDRKSTRLNSSHGYISYAAFCLKKKK